VPDESFRVVRLGEVEPISVAGVNWLPLRRRLGVGPFGINGYTADAGEELIEEHDETGSGAGAHAELYVVVSGRATFTVGGEEIDAPAGTLVFVSDLASRRHAVAQEDGTTALVIGGPPANEFPVSPWEYYFAAQPAYDAGDYARAAEIASEGLIEHPEHPTIHYQLACFYALGGERERTLEHLKLGVERNPKLKEWAAKDADLDSIRDDPSFPA
jgi:mannose-6-phosphate isomerase-like protein (cupin superfamily)